MSQTKLLRQIPFWRRYDNIGQRFGCLTKRQYVPGGKWSDDDVQLPPEPTNCCMSGCANCVWIKYAQEIERIFKDGGEKARRIILAKISDVNMKAFLELELSKMNNHNEK